MSNERQNDFELPDVYYFGGCPECTLNNGHLNVGRTHWMVCHKHRVRWCIGSNLFSVWRYESEEDWERNARLLDRYKEVEPLMSTRYRS